jgi:benzoyl-CoA reductase/2-hydroxyglutaryl-CoA dehydratase subunit BcrC/BadD/HgdB
MSDFLQLVQQRYAQRDQQQSAQPSLALVGCVGMDVPLAMITAAGLQPLRLDADLRHVPAITDRYGATGHPVLRSLVGELLGGRYSQVRRLVISSTPRNQQALHGFLQAMQAQGGGFPRFELFQLDLPRSDSASATSYGRDNLQRLRAQLAVWSGQALSDESLQRSIAEYNRVRSLLVRFDQLRCSRADVSGVVALQVHASAAQPDRQVFLPQLDKWLDEPAPSATRPAPPRIIFSGTATAGIDTYAQIEATGLRIVDDDQDSGSRAVGPLVDETAAPLEAILASTRHRNPAAVGSSSAERARYLLSRVALSGADGVLFANAAYDHPSGWDYPTVAAALDKAAIAHAALDPYYYRDSALVTRGASALAAKLGARTQLSATAQAGLAP